MGHAYVLPKGREEALVLGICSSAEEDLAESLMSLHTEPASPAKAKPAPVRRLAAKR
jgi:hypothetical protein